MGLEKHLPEWLQGWKVTHVCLVYCAVGCFFLMFSLFIPRWRVDDVGTADMQLHWTMEGLTFESRQYGIIYVRGSYSQSWQTMADAACDFQNLGYITGWISATANANSGDNGCDKDECSGGFFSHMADRCYVYRNIRTASMTTMGVTFLTIMMTIVGCMIALMASTKRMGGIVFALFFIGGTLSLLVSLWWVFATDSGFKQLGESAYFPYPSIGMAWFLHVYGCVTILVSAGVYGWIVYPVVVSFDDAENKMQKKIARLERRQEQRQLRKEAEQQAQMQQAQQMQHLQMHDQAACMAQSYPQPQAYGQGIPNTGYDVYQQQQQEQIGGQDIKMGPISGANMQVGQAKPAGQQMMPPANF